MSGLTLAALLLAQAVGPAPATRIRAFDLAFVDEKGGEVADLRASDVAVVENGVTREITSFKRDARPLAIAILVDSSAAVADSYRLNLVDAVLGLIARFPEDARYTIWTTGDRPTRLTALTNDPVAARAALRRVVPQGGSTMLDAVAEASAELAKHAREDERTLLLAISGSGPELSSRDKLRATEEARRTGVWLFAVEFDQPESDLDARTNLGYLFDQLARVSGGRYEVVLSPMSVDGALRKVWAAVRGSYRLAYATTPDAKKRKLRIDVARPGTSVLLPAAATEQP